MGRKELMEVLRAIARIVFFESDDMSAEEKVIRIKSLLIDVLTEVETPPMFGEQK